MSYSSSSSATESEATEAVVVKPFLKWAGGKSQLVSELIARLPKQFNRYFEPFIGGGALYFKLAPRSASISDINKELVNCYQVVRDCPDELIKCLEQFKHEKNFFYELRNIDRSPEFLSWTEVKRAARLIYLNKTCFNGLYRVNSKGQFNVPFGSYKNPKLIDEKNLFACAKLLSGTQVECASFLSVEEKASAGDFVYFDPPYVPLSLTSNFTSYAQEAFGKTEQIALRDLCQRLDNKGVFWMLSNSSADLVQSLYSSFKVSSVFARRSINATSSGRGTVAELIVTNF